MDQDSILKRSSEFTSLGGKSWTAYARVLMTGAALLLIVTPVVWVISTVAGLVMLSGSLAFIAYQFLLMRSYHLFYDEDGVWVSSGILPWNRGTSGVKWRDLDEAVFFQSLGSWLFKSYSIHLKHRYTKANEIVLSHWSNGDQVVMAINDEHANLVRSSSLN